MNQPATITRNHPIRGVLWGLMLGIGLAVVLTVTKVISLALVSIIIVVAIAIVVGIVWGMFGPAKAPQGQPPATRAAVVNQPSRFDDFDDPDRESRDDALVGDGNGDATDSVGDDD